MGAIDGKLIGMKINGSFVSCETSCSIHMDRETLPSSAVTSGGWKEFIKGIRSWTVGVNGNLLLESVPSDIKSIITSGYINDQDIFVEFSTRVSSTIQLVFSGIAIFQNADITAPSSGKANWQVNFQGSGPLASTYQDFDLLIDSMPSLADYQLIVDEAQ